MRLEGDVEMTNERTADRLLTQLDCQILTASLRNEAGTEPTGGELARALAEGNARLRSGTRTLLGDLIEYDAVAGVASAGSRDGTSVSVIDEGTASPLSARGIVWDMGRGRIEVRAASAVTTPR